MGFKEALYKPFEEIDKRQGRGGHYDYIKWRHVADRMNDVFDGRWSSSVMAETVTDTDVVVRIAVTVVDPIDGVSFTQEGYGGAPIRAGEETGTAHKSAYSKALKDACRKWGVGLYLDGDNDNSGSFEQPKNITPPTALGGTGMPSPVGFAPPLTNTQAPVGFTPPPQNVPAPPQPTQSIPPVPQEASAPPKMTMPQPPVSGIPSAPAMPSVIGAGMPASINMGPGAGMAPPVSQPINQPVQQEATNADASPDEPGTLTEVQKMAITHMAKSRGATTEEDILTLVVNNSNTGLSRTVPSIDNLSYIEAVAVIKYIKLLNESN